MKLSQVALQLYTLRDHCQTAADLAATLKRIRAMGYRAVELAGVGPIPAAELDNILAGEGLLCCATHEPAKELLNHPAAVVERLQKLRCQYTAYPFPQDVDFTCADAVRQLARSLDAAGAMLHAAGIQLCYHNHAIELARHGKSTILETIYAETNPENLQAELDTYWVQYGGANPAAWCEKLLGRLPLLHLKDYAFGLNNQPVMAEVGSGNIDFATVIAAAEKSGCKWFIVEQDVCPGDPFASVKQSFDYLQAHLVS
ncbi:MAG: sugar phosphate isomerase/epimerase [Chthoniobacterales bacterium]